MNPIDSETPMLPQEHAGDDDRIAETAACAARLAGAIQMEHFRNRNVPCTRLIHDVKLETDRRCEAAVIDAIRSRFPDHAVLAEESGELPGSADYRWVVDPLDGTVNFWHGLPFFCVSIACYRNGAHANRDAGGIAGRLGTPVTGAVFLPFSGELFVARPGRGAFLNDRSIRVCTVRGTGDAVVTVSFGKTPAMMQRMNRRLEALLPRVRKARCMGAAAAELAYVAAGFLGGLIYEGIKLWDFAAGRILIEEAGGFLEAVEVEPGLWRVVAGTPGIRDALLSVMDL